MFETVWLKKNIFVANQAKNNIWLTISQFSVKNKTEREVVVLAAENNIPVTLNPAPWLRTVLEEAGIKVRALHKFHSMTLAEKQAFIEGYQACDDGTCHECATNRAHTIEQ